MFISHTISRAHLRDARRALNRTASQFVYSPLSCLHAIENPLLSGTRIQRTFGKAFESDNFCPRDFTQRGGRAGCAPSKKNLTEANKINAFCYIRIYIPKIEALFKCEYKIFTSSVNRLSPKDVGRPSPTAQSRRFHFSKNRESELELAKREISLLSFFLFFYRSSSKGERYREKMQARRRRCQFRPESVKFFITWPKVNIDRTTRGTIRKSRENERTKLLSHETLIERRKSFAVQEIS